VSQRNRRRAWSVLILLGSILTAAARWNLAEYEGRAANPRDFDRK
jgi:hypothetical protein